MKEIREIVDQLYIAEEAEKEKVSAVVRSGSPTTILTTQQMRVVEEKWDKLIKNIMSISKRFANRMLRATRLSV